MDPWIEDLMKWKDTDQPQIWFTRKDVQTIVALAICHTAEEVIEMIRKQSKEDINTGRFLGDDTPSICHIGNIKDKFLTEK